MELTQHILCEEWQQRLLREFRFFFYKIIQSIGNCFGARVCHSIFVFFASHSFIHPSLYPYCFGTRSMFSLFSITFFQLITSAASVCSLTWSPSRLRFSSLLSTRSVFGFAFCFTRVHISKSLIFQCIQVSQSLTQSKEYHAYCWKKKKRIKNIELIWNIIWMTVQSMCSHSIKRMNGIGNNNISSDNSSSNGSSSEHWAY